MRLEDIQIAGELGRLDQLSWVVTAYLLTSTVSAPLYGKLGDLYGRKPLFQLAIVIFLVGSALSGLSQGMLELILFRAVQGLGAGGLIGWLVATRQQALSELLEDWSPEQHEELTHLLRRLARELLQNDPQPEFVSAQDQRYE